MIVGFIVEMENGAPGTEAQIPSPCQRARIGIVVCLRTGV